MIAGEHTQSLNSFRTNVSETLDRVNQTGEAEIITVNGEARGVLLSAAAYDELAKDAQLARDVAAMRRAMKQIDDGDYVEAEPFFDGLRAKLLAMKAERETKALE